MHTRKATNTGEAFITQLKSAGRFKVSIPVPCREGGKRFTCSVAYNRKAETLGLCKAENEALKRAIELRNLHGNRLWKKFWPKVLKDDSFLVRLPKTLEPHIHTVGKRKDGSLRQRYVVKHRNATDDKVVSEVFPFTDKASKLAAFVKAKRRIREINQHVLPVISYIDRVSSGAILL
ncbi:TPA: hypothetical protein ACGU7T_004355 [Vibrio vulnificus]|uniref:hypothetical protein n=1 Tax=Vibrio vulnificus TaxID=672 RepID=UPI001A1C458E|nr:hypothetical protein [Vibrio vulnificus]HAS6415613.1 hypothetical protein [Vibrio vulnificus]HDY7429303.1 hypothetical protein [Vibrio vulnificus]HDY7488513.1 hypothetical protein [Vibrio vulnificus]HDY7951865.1 hypothetical protein [Vibrio vulnificus]